MDRRPWGAIHRWSVERVAPGVVAAELVRMLKRLDCAVSISQLVSGYRLGQVAP
jgi:hypothetical protein